jgi:hypothetical protein
MSKHKPRKSTTMKTTKWKGLNKSRSRQTARKTND